MARGKEYLARSKRTQSYTEDDFNLLEELMENVFAKVYTTPNVLTEVSNLGPDEIGFFSVLQTVVQVLDERYCTSRTAVDDPSFVKIGLTDSALLTLGQEFLIVTADVRLYSTLRSRNIDAVNFTHIRQFPLPG